MTRYDDMLRNAINDMLCCNKKRSLLFAYLWYHVLLPALGYGGAVGFLLAMVPEERRGVEGQGERDQISIHLICNNREQQWKGGNRMTQNDRYEKKE
jgi:hypothetical protein